MPSNFVLYVCGGGFPISMKEIPVNSLSPETYFNAPMYLDETYIVLTPDIPLTADLINRLKIWGYRTVLSGGMAISAPEEKAAAETQGAPVEMTKTLGVLKKIRNKLP